MTQFDDRVEHQRLKLEAEQWANGIKSIHAHQIKSMWYDDRPQDTDDGAVTDTQHNSGIIVRSKNGKKIHVFGIAKTGNALTDSYLRNTAR